HGGFFSTIGGPADLKTSQLLMLPLGVSEGHAGDVMHVRVVVENFGPRDAEDVTVIDGLPAGGIFDDARSFGGGLDHPCTFNSGYLSCPLSGSIPNGGGQWVDLYFHMQVAGSVVNNATVTSAGNSDPDPTNNASALTIDVLP